MPGKLSCPHCNAPLAADPELAGQSIKCYDCGKAFDVKVDETKLPVITPLTVINVIEEFLEGEFGVHSAQNLAEVPADDLFELVAPLHKFYLDWMENQVEARWNVIDSNDYHPFMPYPPEFTPMEHLNRWKKLLLYLPKFSWPDPLANKVFAELMMCEVFGSVDMEKFKQGLVNALPTLMHLTPAVRSGEITLMPNPSILNYSLIQQRGKAEINAIDEIERANLLESFKDSAKHARVSHPEGTNTIFDASKLWGNVCSLLRYSPVATDPLIHDILRAEYASANPVLSRVSHVKHRTTSSLYNYELPGVENIELEKLLELRQSAEAFGEWRNGIVELVDHVQNQESEDSEQQQIELAEAAEAILRPKFEKVEKDIKGSSLEKLLVPGGISATAVSVTYYATGNLPVAAATGGILTTGCWVADKIRHRFSKQRRKDSNVREIYSLFLDAG